MKFVDNKDVSSKFARIKHQFIYKKLLSMLIVACIRTGVELIQVKPQFTSKIGLYKYCHQYGLNIHNGAAMVIARRAYGYKETMPKILKDKLITDLPSFNKKTKWGKWSTINKIIEMKGGTGFWQRDRKSMLGLVS